MQLYRSYVGSGLGVLVAGVLLVACGSVKSTTGSTPSSAPPSTVEAITPLPSTNTTLTIPTNISALPALQHLVDSLRLKHTTLSLSPVPYQRFLIDELTTSAPLAITSWRPSPGILSQMGLAASVPIGETTLAITANLPGVRGLQLTPTLVADLYNGTISRWDASPLTAQNPNSSLSRLAVLSEIPAAGTVLSSALAGYLGSLGPIPTHGSVAGCPQAIGCISISPFTHATTQDVELATEDGSFVAPSLGVSSTSASSSTYPLAQPEVLLIAAEPGHLGVELSAIAVGERLVGAANLPTVVKKSSLTQLERLASKVQADRIAHS
ncbi:MAG: hypothetical protein ACYDHP_00865 [Ferrimicrobium sp.]